MATEESPDASSPTSTAPGTEKDEESSPSPDIEPEIPVTSLIRTSYTLSSYDSRKPHLIS